MMRRSIRIPKVDSTFYPMRGGLDIVTPAIMKDPGRCFAAVNYEPNPPKGGYRRINGYERFSGLPRPSAASYWVITATITATININDTLTGLASTASGKVLLVSGTTIVLGRVTGTYQNGEALQVGGVTKATSTSTATENGASTPALHSTYRALAANDRRSSIAAVPGSGQIRGGFVFNDLCYVFRDNVGGTAGNLYKESAAGWVQVTFGREIQFTGATGEIFAGNTVTGATSGATAVVVRPMLRTGTWGAAGVGTLVFASVTGLFQNGENLQVGGITKAVANGADSAITRAPGGRIEARRGNFTGAASTRRVYGVDGVNLAFEFDGTTYVPIRTGMTTDTPSHMAIHKGRLFLSFSSSLQYSGVNAPFSWTVLTGAQEIAVGDTINGIEPQTGNASGASLLVAMKETYAILYGSTSSDFNLVPSGSDLGFEAYTIQSVGNDTFGLTGRGLQSLQTTLNYGDFQYSALSILIQPLLANLYGLQTASVSLKAKNQYRIFFNDNTGLVVGLDNGKNTGIMPVDYGRVVRCIWGDTLADGEEVTFFGSDDGYVYMDNVGTSFDGGVISAFIRPSFNNLQTPQVRKEFKRAFFEVECDGYAEVNVTYDLGYASPDIQPAGPQQDQDLVGAGGYWDQVTWDVFTWDSAVVTTAQISIDGWANNINFLFQSSRAEDDPHTVQGVSLQYVPRRLDRGGP